MNMKVPIVSVHMITYNHDKYIAQAIEGVLMQKTTFPIDLIISDDCSVDGTANIIREYEKKYPEIVKPIYREKNIGSKKNWVDTFNYCKGKYISLCEGDDYWTDSYKLQKQVDFLEATPDFSICSHNVLVKYEGQNKQSKEWLGAAHKEIMTIEDLISEGSGGATNSLVFRNRVFGEFPNLFYKTQSADVPLQILCTSKGKMKYFKEVMGVYRKHDSGISAMEPGSQTIIDYFQNEVRTQNAINKHFNYRYDKSTRKHLINYVYPHLVRAYLGNSIKSLNSAKAHIQKMMNKRQSFQIVSLVQIFILKILSLILLVGIFSIKIIFRFINKIVSVIYTKT